MARPQLWVLAGGNGAGKSTFYAEFLAPRGIPIVNADQIAAQLDPQDTVSASYRAARLADRIREQLLLEGQTFCFETVFSHPSKVDFVARARARDYEIILVFIHLDNVALNKARVHQRISTGGHPVPDEKIESRLPRTLRHVGTAIALCDRVELLDNARHDDPFRRIASVIDGIATSRVEPLPGWATELLDKI